MDIPKRFENCFILFSDASLLVNYLESQLFIILLYRHYWIQHQSHLLQKLLTDYKKLTFFLSLNWLKLYLHPTTFRQLFQLSVQKTHRSYLLWQMIYSPIFSLLILHDDVNGNSIALLHTDNQLLLLRKLFSSLIFLLAVGYHRNLKYDL